MKNFEKAENPDLVEKIDASSAAISHLNLNKKTLSRRAIYSRRFMQKNGLSNSYLSEISLKAGIKHGNLEDDKEMVKLVVNLQAWLGFEKRDHGVAQDGMLGPRTFDSIAAKARHVEARGTEKADSKLARDDLSTDFDDLMSLEPNDRAAVDDRSLTPAVPAADNVDATKAEPEEAVIADANPRDDLIENPEIQQDAESQRLMDILKPFEGKKWVGKLPGNGNRDVIVYVPKGIDPSKKIEINYHFHGTHSHLIDAPLPALAGTSKKYQKKIGKKTVGKNRLYQAIASADSNARQGKNMIMVYPISAGQRGKRNTTAYREGYDFDWMATDRNGESMEHLHKEVLGVLRKSSVVVDKPKVSISGHSAGGIALTNIICSGFKPDRVRYLDATYGFWPEKAYSACGGSASDIQFEFYVRPKTWTDSGFVRKVKNNKNVDYITSHIAHGKFIEQFI